MKKPRGFVVDGVEVDPNGKPINQPDPAPADAAAGQELLQANESLKADLDKANAELDELKSQLKTLTTARDGSPQELKDAQRQILAQSNEVAGLKMKVDETGMALKAARAELETAQHEGNEAQAQVATLSEQLKAAQAKALPDDAEARLVEVKGIGESLAKQAIAALTAPAQK